MISCLLFLSFDQIPFVTNMREKKTRALLLGLAKSIYYGQTNLAKKKIYYRAKHLPCFLYYLQT